MKERILIVEDEKNILRFIKNIIESNGYDPIVAKTGEEAYSMIGSHRPDLVLLDLGLPDMDGVNIIKNVRSWTRMPIIVVSARSSERDKVEALDLGADDYITKPFSANELTARVRVALRHAQTELMTGDITSEGKFTVGNLTVDYDKHLVVVEGKEIHLTNNEFKIVSLLSKRAGKVLTYDFILKEIWGQQSSDTNQILRVNMANIRRKIEKNPADPKYIFTEVGVGYRMMDEES